MVWFLTQNSLSLSPFYSADDDEKPKQAAKEWNAPRWMQGLVVKPDRVHIISQARLWGIITMLGIAVPPAQDYLGRFTWLVRNVLTCENEGKRQPSWLSCCIDLTHTHTPLVPMRPLFLSIVDLHCTAHVPRYAKGTAGFWRVRKLDARDATNALQELKERAKNTMPL